MQSSEHSQVAELTITGADSRCSYLPTETSRFHYRWAADLSTERYQHLLQRGWRRFGRTLFRPACRQCFECRSLRIPLSQFRLSRSQRRCLNRNADIRVVIRKPTLTEDHLRLHNEYHRDMSVRRGWPYREISADEYYQSFIDGQFEFAREFLYLRHDRLIGVGLVDMTNAAQSSVYFVHDPAWRDQGPGTFSVLSEIEAGRADHREYHYLGYYIRDCGSMNYKNRFRPHQLLRDLVSDAEDPVWQSPEDRNTAPPTGSL